MIPFIKNENVFGTKKNFWENEGCNNQQKEKKIILKICSLFPSTADKIAQCRISYKQINQSN